jgi:hypothetical protein
MYLSKPILFIIIVVVLVVGGTSKLMYEDDGNGGGGSDSDSESDDSSVSSVSSGSGSDDGRASKREGAVGSRPRTSCKPGCIAASSSAASGNCKWLPERAPKSQQRYICPHTCDIAKGSKEAGGCEFDMDCGDCTPQRDYTADAYAGIGIAKGSNTCVKGAECAINSAFRGLTICNPKDAPNVGKNNLICAKDPASALSDDPSVKPRYVWTDAKSAAEAIPYTTSQSALLTCDVKRACANDGDSCVDAEGKRIFCKNNLWLGDPKYDKNQYDSSTKSNIDNNTKLANSDNRTNVRKSGSGVVVVSDDTIRDNYYITNYFYGPSKQKRENRIGSNSIKKVVHGTGHVVDKVASGIKGAYTDIKNTFTPPLPKQMNYGVNDGSGTGSNSTGVIGGGNTLVPNLVPKGVVATVQPYESSIRL